MNRDYNPVDDPKKRGDSRDESEKETGKGTFPAGCIKEGNEGDPDQELEVKVRIGEYQKNSREKAKQEILFLHALNQSSNSLLPLRPRRCEEN
jgi:hypothetical protein